MREGSDAEPIPISAVQHAVYCLRQAALIHIECAWVENRFTAEGQVLHVQTDKPKARHQRGGRRVTALRIASRRLGIAGVADLVEFLQSDDGELAYPVEFKRGKPKLHRADEAQLCAQALCLEEMTGRAVREGAVYYAEIRRRLTIPIDTELRRLTEETIAALRDVFNSGCTPPPTAHKNRCRACSLLELCRPVSAGRDVRAWRSKMVNDTLCDEAP